MSIVRLKMRKVVAIVTCLAGSVIMFAQNIITPNTKFTNTISSNGSHHYMISHKDGNLYYRITDWNSRYSKNELVLKNVKTIYGSPHHSDTRFALQNDGNLWAWGNNESGKVGDNTGINKDAPVKILDNVKDFTVHENCVFAVKNDGTVYAWGVNRFASNDRARFAPEKINIENVSYIFINENTVSSVSFSGEIYQWRTNPPQKMPDEGEKPLWGKRQPLISNSHSNIATVHTYSTGGSYITENGDLYSWGDVTGNGTNIPVSKDDPILVLQNVKQICAGRAVWSGSKTFRYALCTDGKLYMVDIDKTFKYVQVSSNVYLLNTSINYINNIERGTVSYYTYDGSVYEYSYGGKPKKIFSDIALPQIKFDDVNIVRYSPNGYIQDIGNHFGISDVSVLIYAGLIVTILTILSIMFRRFRIFISYILGIIVIVAIIVALIYAAIALIKVIAYAIAGIIVLFWILGGGIRRQWDRDH